MSKRPIETIIIDDTDSEDEDLATALKLSKMEAQQNNKAKFGDSSSRASGSGSTSGARIGVASLSKKQRVVSPPPPVESIMSSAKARHDMEMDRLARVQKIADENGGEVPRTNILTAATKATFATVADLDTGSSNGSSSGISSTMKENYWNPEIKRVANRFSSGDGGLSFEQVLGSKTGEYNLIQFNISIPKEVIDSILWFPTLTGVLGKDHPTLAIVSSFAIDEEWLCSNFAEETSLLIVRPPPDNNRGPPLSQIAIPEKRNNLFMLLPKMPEKVQGAMHIKCCVVNRVSFILAFISRLTHFTI